MKARRRVVLALGAAALAPLAALTQQKARVHRIGYLATANPELTPAFAAFREGLRERGYMEGENLVIEQRWADGSFDRHPGLAEELVRARVEVIFAWGTPAVEAAKRATTVIPIVFVGVGDPLGSGFVASLGRPGRNITGMTNIARDISAKRLELLVEVVGRANPVAVLRNPVNPFSAAQVKELEPAARALGVNLQYAEARTPADLEAAFATLARGRIAGVIVLAEPMFVTARRKIAELANKQRLPTIHPNSEGVVAGGLMSYGVNAPEMFRRGAHYVDRILRGTNPAELPVEQPTTFELVVNLKTSRAIGVSIPESIVSRADRVIE